MVDPKELDVEIARLEYAPSSYENYSRLAILYIIRDHAAGAIPANYAIPQIKQKTQENTGDTVQGNAIPQIKAIEKQGDPASAFLRAIDGKPAAPVYEILDDLIDTLSVTNPRVYNSVMQRLDAIE